MKFGLFHASDLTDDDMRPVPRCPAIGPFHQRHRSGWPGTSGRPLGQEPV